jgi:hypothetical protein
MNRKELEQRIRILEKENKDLQARLIKAEKNAKPREKYVQHHYDLNDK